MVSSSKRPVAGLARRIQMNLTTIIAGVSDVVERAFQETRSWGNGATIQGMEAAVWKAVRQIGRLMIQGQADEAGDGYVGSRMPCECGAMMRFIGDRSRTVATWCGQMTLKRAYYRCDRCGASAFPLDKQLCMPEGRFSESIIKAISYCSAQLPFECASETMERLTGISVSPKEAQILSEGIGAEMDEELRAQARIAVTDGLESASKPDRLYVTIDGVMVRELDGWHETKVSAVYDAVLEVGSDGLSMDAANDITYVARKASPDELGAHVSAEAQQRGEANAAEVIALGDGAVWIWNLVDTYFPEAVQIIDWYHASEHIWKFARILYDGDEDRCKARVDEQLGLLSDGQVEELVGQLRAMTDLRDEASAERDSLARYLETNRERMRYDEYRAKGYHIGSGIVESACKNVVQMRQKRPGMRWSAEGSQKILNLRTYVLNGKWDEFWRNRRGKTRSGVQVQSKLLRAA